MKRPTGDWFGDRRETIKMKDLAAAEVLNKVK